MSKAPDRRIRKTKHAIKETLIALLKEKPVREISVIELSDRADINRGTFYLHYKDIFDLLEQIEQEFFDELKEIMNSYTIQDLNGSPLPLLEGIFHLLEENVSLCIVLLSPNGSLSFINQLKDMIREICFDHWSYLFHKDKNAVFEYYYSYMLSGCIGLIETWLLNENRESPDEIALLVQDMVLRGVEVLK